MRDSIVTIAIILALISLVAFFIGFILLFFESKRKIAAKILLYSFIGFVIGFGTCTASIS